MPIQENHLEDEKTSKKNEGDDNENLILLQMYETNLLRSAEKTLILVTLEMNEVYKTKGKMNCTWPCTLVDFVVSHRETKGQQF